MTLSIPIKNCIGCESNLISEVGTLGYLPNCNFFPKTKDEAINLQRYNLNVVVCNNCKLAQVGTHLPVESIFNNDYPYFSSASSSWLSHSKDLANYLSKKLSIEKNDLVVELGSNDGYFLKNFSKQIKTLGIEPSKAPAKKASEIGIETINDFFSENLATQILSSHGKAKIIASMNMLAHSPDLRGILNGVKTLLKSDGVFISEIQYSIEMFKSGKFDTIYHEHFSYFSLTSILNIFETVGLNIFDVEFVDTHGGSMRIFASPNNSKNKISENISRTLNYEKKIGVNNLDFYSNIFSKANTIKENFKSLIDKHKYIIGYGAPTKGSVFCNFCELSPSDILHTTDVSELKQGNFMPGTGIPILPPTANAYMDSDAVVVFPWNISEEIKKIFSKWFPNKKNFLYVAVPELKKIL